jgi:hypothetical protein
VTASLRRFVEKLEQTARSANMLHGQYLVSFTRPIDDFGDVKDVIRSALVAYLQSTRDDEQAARKEVYKAGPQRCSITKVHSKSNGIYLGHGMPARWEGEAALEICKILEDRIIEKRYKLRNVTSQKILLLYDRYHYAEPPMFKACLLGLAASSFFHTIFVVQSDAPGFVLCSHISDWES